MSCIWKEFQKRDIGVVTLYLLGMKKTEIAELYGFSRQRATQIICDRFGCEPRYRGRSTPPIEHIKT
jgi:hypothetical protein